MSKVKSPQQKKELSLGKDRRNLYGECPTSSRKNIRRGKQRSRRELRRGVSQQLTALTGCSNDLPLDEVDVCAKSKVLAAKRSAFKKKPDTPLRKAIALKAKRRTSGQKML